MLHDPLSNAEFRPVAGTHRNHAVQFYEDEAFLAEVVARHLNDGLGDGEALLLIATESHRHAVLEKLSLGGCDVEALLKGGLLAVMDARETLSHFMVGQAPDRERFNRHLSEPLRRLGAMAPRRCIRAYGEMVDLLWRDGNSAAALRLEDLWNETAQRHNLSLLCAYAMSNFDSVTQSPLFHRTCEAHAQVLPTEDYWVQLDEGARLREVAVLQQRAKALEGEIARREQIEKDLLNALSLREDFLAVAGHELRTPLTVLQLQVQALMTTAPEPVDERFRERLERLGRHTEKLAGLVGDLLDVSRIDSGHLTLARETVSLQEVVHEAMTRTRVAAGRAGCGLRFEAPERPVVGCWDRLRIRQVVSHILDNAVKYGSGRPIEVSLEELPDRARISIRDQGIGISLKDQERIFKRFERAVSSRNYGGLGLGLWIASQIVCAHAGTLRVESELGKGALFVMELPRG